MENPEEILHSLEEFSKSKPKDIPRELEEYLCFVAKTGDPVYQWSSIKHLFKEKLINVVNEFFDSCPAVDIPPCPNVEVFNYDTMKSFILEKLETFIAAPFTVQRICELLTTPRKEYNRIDKYMRALEKNILVVSTIEPGCKNTENGENVLNGLESEYPHDSGNLSSTEINVVEMDDNFKYRQMEIQTPEQNKTDKNKDNETEKPKTEETSSWLKSEQMEIQFQDSTAKENEKIEKEPASSSCESTNLEVEVEEKQKKEENVPSTSSVEESSTCETSMSINEDVIVPEALDEPIKESVDSSYAPLDTIDSEAVSSAEVKESVSEEREAILQDNEKQVDSTTNSRPQEDQGTSEVSTDESKPNSVEEIQNAACESSESENVNIDSDSNQSSISTEPDTGEESQENTDSNEARDITKEEREESLAFSEDSNLSPADTTKNMNVPAEPSFEDAMEEDKEQEISSSDKVVVSNSLDDITDDESEAEAEVLKDVSDKKEEEEKVQIVPEVSENESLVTASSDELKKDCDENAMEVDSSKEKGDFNEAESTNV